MPWSECAALGALLVTVVRRMRSSQFFKVNDIGMLQCYIVPPHLRSHLRCSQGFITKRDVEIVRRSTKGLGTNEARLMDTLCNRTKKQLDSVDALYHKTVGRRRIGWCERNSPGVHNHVLLVGFSFGGFQIILARAAVSRLPCAQHNLTLLHIVSRFYA